MGLTSIAKQTGQTSGWRVMMDPITLNTKRMVFSGQRDVTYGLNEAVNFEKRGIFVAVPKTGTTSIRKQLATEGDKLIPAPHLTIMQIRDALYTYLLLKNLGNNHAFPTQVDQVPSDAEIRAEAAAIYSGFFKFSSVRNPWARVVSLYSRREGVKTLKKADFESFCESLRYASDTCSQPTRCASQHDWMTDETGNLAVDYVLKLEDLDRGLQEINDRTEGRLRLVAKHNNQNPASRSANYRELYTPQSRNLIGDLFARDVAAFGYEF